MPTALQPGETATKSQTSQQTSPSQAETPLKVLFFYQDFGAVGGIEKYIEQVAGQFRNGGRIEPVVVCTKNTPFYNRLRIKGIPVHGVKSPKWCAKSVLRLFDLPAFLQVASILRQEKPDLVHVNIGLVETLLFRLLGYPTVYTFHGYSTLYSMESDSAIKTAFKTVIRKLFNITAEKLDALMFVSEAERLRTVAEGFVPDGIGEVMLNGLNLAELNAVAAETEPSELKDVLRIPAEAKCVSFINRLDANKNPLQFFEMAEWISGDVPDVHFLIAGDGPLRDEVKARWKKSPINHRIHLLGSRGDIPAILRISDVVVQLSNREGFGLGVLEAMALGRPCVGYQVGGIPEILGAELGETCLVPHGDLNRLVDRVQKMLGMKEPERAALSQKLSARAMHFDIAPMTQNLEATYRRVLSAKAFQPTVSVILPVYNGAGVVPKSIRSVLNQTYQNIELIVINDGSTDETLAVLNAINDDPRMQVITQPNAGVSEARNHAFTYAKGDYIAFIDADDVWFPEKIEREIAVLQKKANRVAMVYSGYYAVDEENRPINLPKVWQAGGDLSDIVVAHEGIFLPSTTLIHREIYEKLNGFAAGCYHEDRAFFIEACQSYPAYPTNERLVVYRQSMSGRCRSILQNFDHALHAELSIVETLKPVLKPEQLTLLAAGQTCHLFNRFMMYGYLENARKLFPQVNPEMLKNKKGRLALLSLQTGISLLSAARQTVQLTMRYALTPWWLWKIRFMGADYDQYLHEELDAAFTRRARRLPMKPHIVRSVPAC